MWMTVLRMSLEIEKEFIQITDRSFLIRVKSAVKLSGEEFNELLKLCPTVKNRVLIHGKKIETPRFQRLYGEAAYRFSGITLAPDPLTNSVLIYLLELVNRWEGYSDLPADSRPYNGMLVNWYLDGSHYIGPHADDERDLLEGAPIYSFSFGATRTFRFHPKTGGVKVLDIPLEDGTMIAMCGDCQKELKHSVPKDKWCKTPRINVTIRAFKKGQL